MKRLSFLIAASVATPALAQSPQVIFSSLPNDPTSLVPGGGGLRFNGFNNSETSPSSGIFAVNADTFDGRVLVVGGAGFSTPTLVAQENVTDGLGEPGEVVGFIDNVFGLNDSGVVAYSSNTRDGGFDDETIFTVDAFTGTTSVAAREGQIVPGFTDAEYGSEMLRPGILNDGTVYFEADQVSDVPFSQNGFIILGDQIIAQSAVTTPPGQAGSEPFDNFGTQFQPLEFTSDGQHSLFIAELDTGGLGSEVLVIDGTVVIEEDVTIAKGLTSTVDSIIRAELGDAGDWIATVANNDGSDAVLLNGDTVAANGTPVPGGIAGEVFTDSRFSITFNQVSANADGAYVFSGNSNIVSEVRDSSLILGTPDGEQIMLAREGDAVDLDGNGLLDDGVFLGAFSPYGSLTDDTYYFVAGLYDQQGNDLGETFYAIAIPEPTTTAVLFAAGGLVLRRCRRS
jgi:hypothetical protein